MKHIIVLLLFVVGGCTPRVAIAQGQCRTPSQYRSKEEHKAFFFLLMNRRPPQSDPAVLQALNALQQNQARMIELIAALNRQPAPATDPALIALLQQQRQAPQQPPTIIIVHPEGVQPRQILGPEKSPRVDLQPQPLPRNPLDSQPLPRNPLDSQPLPRQPDLAPEGQPRQKLEGDGKTVPGPATGKPLGVTPGTPKGFTTYTRTIWTKGR